MQMISIKSVAQGVGLVVLLSAPAFAQSEILPFKTQPTWSWLDSTVPDSDPNGAGDIQGSPVQGQITLNQIDASGRAMGVTQISLDQPAGSYAPAFSTTLILEVTKQPTTGYYDVELLVVPLSGEWEGEAPYLENSFTLKKWGDLSRVLLDGVFTKMDGPSGGPLAGHAYLLRSGLILGSPDYVPQVRRSPMNEMLHRVSRLKRRGR
jgi:hypothetical protein